MKSEISITLSECQVPKGSFKMDKESKYIGRNHDLFYFIKVLLTSLIHDIYKSFSQRVAVYGSPCFIDQQSRRPEQMSLQWNTLINR